MRQILPSVWAVPLLFGTALAASQSGSQVLNLDTQTRLEAYIAKDYLNRLAISQDRITEVFGDEETYVMQVDENTGQIFLKPSEANGSKPISLTIITENGQTQDLTLKPTDRQATTIIMKGVRSQGEQGGGKYEAPPQNIPLIEKTLPFQEKIIHAMKLVTSNQVPSTEHDPQYRPCPEGFNLSGLKVFQIGPFKGSTYEIKNTTETSIEIDEKVFYQPGDMALCFAKRVLKPTESTTLNVIHP